MIKTKIYSFVLCCMFSVLQASEKNELQTYIPSLFEIIPRELKLDMLSNTKFPFKYAEINHEMYYVAVECIKKQWNWPEKIPCIFNETILNNRARRKKGELKLSYKNIGPQNNEPSFIQEMYLKHFKNALPFFMHYNNLKHYDRFHSTNIFCAKDLSSPITTKILRNVSKTINGTTINETFYENVKLSWQSSAITTEDVYCITIDLKEKNNINLLNTLANHQDKSVVLIIKFNTDLIETIKNFLIYLNNYDDIKSKIFAIMCDIDKLFFQDKFNNFIELLKEIGNWTQLSVPPFYRLTAIQHDIQIITPQLYKKNENLFKSFIKNLHIPSNYNAIDLQETLFLTQILSCYQRNTMLKMPAFDKTYYSRFDKNMLESFLYFDNSFIKLEYKNLIETIKRCVYNNEIPYINRSIVIKYVIEKLIMYEYEDLMADLCIVLLSEKCNGIIKLLDNIYDPILLEKIIPSLFELKHISKFHNEEITNIITITNAIERILIKIVQLMQKHKTQEFSLIALMSKIQNYLDIIYSVKHEKWSPFIQSIKEGINEINNIINKQLIQTQDDIDILQQKYAQWHNILKQFYINFLQTDFAPNIVEHNYTTYLYEKLRKSKNLCTRLYNVIKNSIELNEKYSILFENEILNKIKIM